VSALAPPQQRLTSTGDEVRIWHIWQAEAKASPKKLRHTRPQLRTLNRVADEVPGDP
jgi:hypothetical protein